MNEWRSCTLGDVLTLQRGFDITKAAQREGSVPVVSSSGINSYHDEAKVGAPGVVIGRKGTLGTHFFLEAPFWPHDTTLWVKDFKGNDPKFCYYLLGHMELAKHDVGAANPTLNRNHVHLLPVACPTLDTQRRIASILGAYDDLIEVNRRRVVVLEEMARRLFEEWFVRFRFPGYESIAIVDTPNGPLPDGWAWHPFSALATYTNGFAFKPGHFEPVGMPIVKIPELKTGVSAKTSRNSGVDVPDLLHIKTGDLLFSWSGTLAISEWTCGDALLNQHLFLVVPTSNVSRGFLKQALIGALPRFHNQGVGATMKHIRRAALDQTYLALPRDDALIEHGNRVMQTAYDQIVNLRQQNDRLTTSRDFLLPRLISGQLPVDAAQQALEMAA